MSKAQVAQTCTVTGKRDSDQLDVQQANKRRRSLSNMPPRTQEEQAEAMVLVEAITEQLTFLCRRNRKDETTLNSCADERSRIFYGAFKQPFPLQHYVQRLVDHTKCSNSAFVAALVYLRRIQVRYPSLRVTDFTVHRLLITSVVLATKYLEDEVYENAYYARVGGVETHEMNKMEVRLLGILGYDLSLDHGVYHLFEDGLMSSSGSSSSGEDNESFTSEVSSSSLTD
eukprot:CAMPEP_0198324950 /NCGR_PEP_ID=MMETSP1450-20131203/12835_1 /TAXON_ID=753684 ORGANISM="Madagascaria erythrocladiodes, Strain CCMP3234" /NCGR_SAMPLE_ID=MMETSP1450 /ASSEMBLY_ACC=CAM_ASM_001115 /LENGTH=227 /DNA_ID=CAMNT_0044028789 /DNA_START=135 /DNA_END=818 /DNA_ORIENTATION=-